ncbi:S8 family serine peptidase [Kangiella shandongensis]|uniref:S8 family serine peptidase n=1 Tax=Kangiella shandongensis TaxID=2763258 RepID=UPI001CC064C0|nr:S8 family serine peptidase [Kangiella shandongensis]
MKTKFLIKTMAIALYSAGVANATAPKDFVSIEPLDINSDLVIERSKRQANQNQTSHLLEGFGQNVHLQPKTKFIPEEGLTGSHRYIIQLKDAPAALYSGDASGQGGTKQLFKNQSKGPRSINLKNNSAVVDYTYQLKNKQNQFVNKAAQTGVYLKVEQDFQIALNAITAKLTQQDAERLAKLPEVSFISRDKHNELLMDVAPESTNVPAVWNDSSFSQAPSGLKGEGMLVGIIDTGVNSDHPSFAVTGDDGYIIQKPDNISGYLHDCQDEPSMCNDKLIGVWSTDVITQTFSDPEYAESRPAYGEDYQGHGSHTASIAAGNVLYDVPYKLPALASTDPGIETPLVLPQMSGVAPHANVISYQVCYQGNGGEDPWVGCPESATVAAIEQAILDGVDVINYSISGGHDAHNDPVEQAFLAAHEAGVNVAASAGNAGVYQSVNHVSPWVMSVGSMQTGREFNVSNYVTMDLSGGNPDFAGYNNLPGSSYMRAYGINLEEISGPMVLSSNYGNEFCDTPFPAGTFTNNEIVFCARGDIPLIEKSANAAAGGAQAVVIYNTPESGTDLYVTIPYDVPTFQVATSESTSSYSQDMVDWLQDGSGHMGTLPVTETSTGTSWAANRMSSFSSGGHAYLPEYREATAPGIVAPGTDIYSAFSDDQPFTLYPSPTEFNMISGTSMSSPHIAGVLTLIKQAHPDWTPSEVMSALQLTAYDDFSPVATNPWQRGSGLAQADKAIHSGLVMDVPVEHYSVANPHAGGNLGALNTPNMVDDSCFQSCTWIREVTATVDGTWTAEGVTGEYSVNIEASPSTFTLKAGETQRLIIKGSWVDSRNAYESPRGLTVFGQLQLKHENPDVPLAQMNVEMVLNSGKLPEVVEYTTHSDHSSYTLNNLFLGNAPALQATAYKPVAANVEDIELLERESGNGSNLFESDNDISDAHVTWVEVPEGAKRLVAEVLESGPALDPHERTAPYGNAGVYVGYDVDNDGVPNFETEAICKSTINSTDLKDWCNIPNPDAGTYWVVFEEHNFNSGAYQGLPQATFPHKVATAVVTGEIANNISVEAPASTTPEESVSVTLDTTMPELTSGDRVYSAVEFGTDSENLDNIGIISTNIQRGIDEVSLQAAKNGGIVNEVIDYKISVLANQTGIDRSYSFSAEIPEDLELVADSVQVSENNYLSEANVVQDGNTFVVSGTQADSRDLERKYNITNSLSDATCKTPVGDGSYVDLYSYGVEPIEGAPSVNYAPPMELSFSEIYQDQRSTKEEYALFNYYDSMNSTTNSLKIHSNGFVSVTGFWHTAFGSINYSFGNEYPHFFPSSLGIFWTGAAGFGSQGMQSGAPYSLDDNGKGPSGISFVRLVDESNTGTHVIVEWDNLQHVDVIYDPSDRSFSGVTNQDSDTRVDAQLILARDYDSAPGAYEMVYAYDNLNFTYYIGNGYALHEALSFENNGTAGVNGFASPWAGAPLEGYIQQSISPDYTGWGGLHNFLKDDMKVCFDYQGPEVTAFDVSFKVKVKPEAIGQEFNINVDSSVDGIDSKVLSESLTLQSNLTIWDIEDQETEENESIEDIEIAYMDNNNVSNIISVTGEGFTADVHGNEPGDTFDIIPDENWHGTTEVTVTVSDVNQPTDSASTKFMLTVKSDGVEYGCTDSSATNYDPDANEDDGSCQYTEEDTDDGSGDDSDGESGGDSDGESGDDSGGEPEDEVEPPSSSSGGGSLHWAVLLLMLFAMTRRRVR